MVLAALLGVAAVGVGAGGAAAADTPGARRAEVIDLKVRNDQYQEVDLGSKGPSLGDTYLYSGIGVKDGRDVASGGGTCQVIRIDGGAQTSQCVLTMELARGSLTMQSLWTSGTTGPLDMAITGGTGDFKAARGTVRFWDIATPNERARMEILR
ncbi:hypothetical protein BIV57_04220 [Mangrovactinospora gilvigrisea]|uniref:Allene oxide cyclase barrel-like domain-containing protein n=2 Tax=Mangrovactinospora gilvigrisea TaxID=1428644 RepID=A0A1J7BJ71_9ACTN|nr:hypothetical protein BIV57_04220 [Mangrovactinospora gilvigrisea]